MALEPKPVGFGTICAFAGASLFVTMQRYDTSRWGWADAVAIGLLLLLLWWCFTPSRRSGLVGADAHEDASKSITFRLGKSLNGIWRSLRR